MLVEQNNVCLNSWSILSNFHFILMWLQCCSAIKLWWWVSNWTFFIMNMTKRHWQANIPTISTDSTGFFYNNTKLTDWNHIFQTLCFEGSSNVSDLSHSLLDQLAWASHLAFQNLVREPVQTLNQACTTDSTGRLDKPLQTHRHTKCEPRFKV